MSDTFDAGRRQFLIRAAGATALTVVGGGLLAACGTDDEPTASGATGGEGSTGGTTPERVALVSMMPFAASLGYVLHLTAKTRGYFEDENLDVDVQFARSAGQGVQSLLGGQAQIAQVGVTNLLDAVAEQGAEATAVAMAVHGMLYRLVSSPANPVRTLDDIVGKKVGLPSLGGHAEETLRLVLQENGIDMASVELVPAGFDAAAFGLVEQGQIDCMYTNHDIAEILKDKGADTVEADLSEAGNPLLGHVIMVTDAYIESNRDAVVGYLRAIDRARADLMDDAEVDSLIEDLKADWDIAALEDPALAKVILGTQRPKWHVKGDEGFWVNDEKQWKRGLAGFEKIGAVEKGIDPTDLYTNDLLDEATGA